MKRVLITRRVFPEVVEELRARFEVEPNDDDHPWPPEELAKRLQGKSGAMATVMDKFDEPVLAQCPELKVISNIAVGYNNIDVAACTRRGIWVTNVMSHWLVKEAEIEAARNILDALSGDTPRGAMNQEPVEVLQTAA